MISRTTVRFRKNYSSLPEVVRKQASAAYRLFIKNPYHPSLNFKKIHPDRQIYSVRININYRAAGIKKKESIIWFWIGSHSDYDKMIKSFRNL